MTNPLVPSVSVIMPVRNEADFIHQSLGALLAQDYPAENLEILVVDGLSTDDTRAFIQARQAQHPNLQLVDNPGHIVPTGFNVALARASGAIIIRVDGHTEIAPDYVRQCVAALQRSGADNVGGRMNAVGADAGAVRQAIALATSTPFGVGGARFHYSEQEEWVDTVYMGAWRREVFERLGGFDEELVRNQDDEFNYRLREQGGRILLCPSIQSRYTPRATFAGLWRQYFQYGFWKVRVMQKHPRQMQPRQFIPLGLVACVLGLALGALVYPPTAWLLGFVLALYGVANLAASLWTAARADWRNFPLLPLAFAILHFSYGLGFLVGLVKFSNRWGDTHGRTPNWETLHARSD